MARRYRQCVVEGCSRKAQLSQMVCVDHEGTVVGITIQREVVKLEREVRALVVAETHEERLKAAKTFRQRVQRGEFAALFSGKFKEMIERAGSVEGLTGEIGALRLAVVRLILEEDDPARMAFALSRVANATANMMRTQAKLSDQQEQVELEIEALWKSFREDKRKEEEKLTKRWDRVREEEERIRAQEMGNRKWEMDGSSPQDRPSPQPTSPQALSGPERESPSRERESDAEEEPFEVTEGIAVPSVERAEAARRYEKARRSGEARVKEYEEATDGAAKEAVNQRAQFMERYLDGLRNWDGSERGN